MHEWVAGVRLFRTFIHMNVMRRAGLCMAFMLACFVQAAAQAIKAAAYRPLPVDSLGVDRPHAGAVRRADPQPGTCAQVADAGAGA